MSDIREFIESNAARVTPAIVQNLLRKLPLLKAEFTQLRAPQFPHLIDQLEFLADVVEDFAEAADREIPYVTVAQAAFAILYVHKHADILPGKVPELGHADDSVVVRWVLIHHEKNFAAYAQRHGMVWKKVTSEP